MVWCDVVWLWSGVVCYVRYSTVRYGTLCYVVWYRSAV